MPTANSTAIQARQLHAHLHIHRSFKHTYPCSVHTWCTVIRTYVPTYILGTECVQNFALFPQTAQIVYRSQTALNGPIWQLTQLGGLWLVAADGMSRTRSPSLPDLAMYDCFYRSKQVSIWKNLRNKHWNNAQYHQAPHLSSFVSAAPTGSHFPFNLPRLTGHAHSPLTPNRSPTYT